MSLSKKNNPQLSWTMLPVSGVISGLISGLLVGGCGKDSKKDQPQTNIAPQTLEAVDTTLTPLPQTQKNKFSFLVASNIKGSKFKCSVVPEAQRAQPVAGWTDCSESWSIDLVPGQNVLARAKAVDPSGKEDQLPAEYLVVSPATVVEQVQKPVVPEKVQIRAMILDKESVGEEVNKKDLTLEFGAEAPGYDSSEISYECKTENDLTFRRCPDKTKYVFKGMGDGKSYKLQVKAVPARNQDNVQSIIDEIAFKVKLSNFDLTGAEGLEANRTGTWKIQMPQGMGPYTCSLTAVTTAKTQTLECKDSLSIDLGKMARGSYRLAVKGKTGEERTVNFCAQECSSADIGQDPQGGGAGGGGAGGGAVIEEGGSFGGGSSVTGPSVHQLGSFYAYTVQPGMHVTQFASTKNSAGILNYYKIANDPFYIGNYSCNGPVDRKLVWQSPRGLPYEYCNSTLRRDDFKFENEGRLATNHIEVATDHDIVSSKPYLNERIFINVFDKDYEYMLKRSRFSSLCAENVNARGRVTKSPQVPVIDANFWGGFTKAEIFACWGQLAESGPGIPTLSNDGWWIGAFYITSNDNLPAYECFKNNWEVDYAQPNHGNNYGAVSPGWCNNYKNPSLIEVVYMTRKPFQQDYLFMQELQAKFRGLLQELRPRQSY